MTIAPWSGWVFEGSGDLPRCWLAIAEWREPASSDRLPVYRSESPTGYSLTGCSPAEPVSASPVADPNNPSLFRRSIKCAARSHGNGADQPAVSLDRTQHRGNADAIGSAAPECHFYFARPVPFLSCADILKTGLRQWQTYWRMFTDITRPLGTISTSNRHRRGLMGAAFMASQRSTT